MQQGIAQALRAVPWLAACGSEVIDALAAHARLQAVADGAAVAWRGRYDDRLLVVVRGMLEVSMASAEGRRHVLNVIGPGTVFGLIPVLDRQPWIHDARARGPGQLLRLPREALLQAMHLHPPLVEAVLEVLCSRARKTYATLAAKSLLELPARVARTLLMLADDRGTSILALSQADLADMLGVTRQSLNGQLQALVRHGILVLGRGRIEIRDRGALRQAAGLWD
jgi:CRP-like cAMP-binding protein